MNEFFSTIFYWLSSIYSQDWDNFLYDQGFYAYLGVILVSFALVSTAIFYFTPTVQFHGRLKWFIFMFISSVLIFFTTFAVSDYWANNASEQQLPTINTMDEIGTSCISVFWGIVAYFLFSLLMRKLSVYNKNVPF